MSLDKERLIALMQYADGELTGDENAAAREAVIASLENDPEARAFLDEMERLGEATRAAEPLALERSTRSGIETFDVADAVMQLVDEHEQKSAVTAPIAGPASPLPNVTSLDLARDKRRRAVVIIATGLALAAGIALVMRSRDYGSEDMKSATATNPGKPVDSVPVLAVTGVPALPSSSEAALAAASASNLMGAARPDEDLAGVEVNISDSTQAGVSVFYLPGSDGTSASAVVWIDESSGGNK